MNNKILGNNKKEVIYLKIKSIEENKPQIKKPLDYSDPSKIFNIIINALMNSEKVIKLRDLIPILILEHPVLNNIYIISKEQWLLYYNYDIIKKCINNKILKVKYDLLDKNENKYTKIIRKNKKNIIRYIMQNIPLKLYSKIFIQFLKDNEDIFKKFIFFFTDSLLNEKLEKTNNRIIKENNLNNIDKNKNSYNLLENNNEEIVLHSDNLTNNKKLYENFDIEFLPHKIDFLKTLEEQFRIFSEKQDYIYKIKEILGEENEYLKTEKNDISPVKTNLIMNINSSGSLGSLSFFDDDFENNVNNNGFSNVLLTQMNPPPNYIKKMLNDDNFFKKINKEEYYIGIEQFKDEMNKQLLLDSTSLKNYI